MLTPQLPCLTTRPWAGGRGIGVGLWVALLVGSAACAGERVSGPTDGLSAHQVGAAAFLEREVVLDLRAVTDERVTDIGRGAVETYRLGDGWVRSTATGRWAVGERAALAVHVTDPTGLGLYLELRGGGVEAVGIRVNDADVGSVAPREEWSAFALPISPGVLAAGQNDVELTFSFGARSEDLDPATFVGSLVDGQRPTVENLERVLPEVRDIFPGARLTGPDVLNLPGVVAADVIQGVDERGVGAGWQWMPVVNGGQSVEIRRIGLVADPVAFEPARRAPGLVREGGPLTVTRSGTLFVPVDGRAPTVSVQLDASAPAGGGPAPRVRLTLVDGSASVPLGDQALAGWWGDVRTSWVAPLDGHRGPACLRLDVDLDAAGEALTLERLKVETREAERVPAYSRPEEHPDIVVVVLDAARADHFGVYGYERDTTPRIDALAAESLVFRHAFATASYTVASMPTMLTGLSFIDHGMFWREHVLADGIDTLAEHLRTAGYRTVCLSANPNHAVARGLGQGCDEFVEFWRRAAPPRSLDPYRVSSRGRQELEAGSDEPLFLLLHYVPPHEPYTPADGFDIFGDDAYAGDYDGSRDTILDIDTGRLRPTAADLAEIVSLYDGNLLTGDDAVGQVLDALRAGDRWDDTVVLVVSDHGEAFQEHGRMSHNTTVYDEMIRVPFVLRLPRGEVPDGVDTDGLVSLEDVVPTLLRVAGVSEAVTSSGVDLLGERDAPRRRAIVARTAANPATYAYRTGGWKLITGGGPSELYDLVSDPAEAENRYLDDLETALCLRALLQYQLDRPSLGATAAEGLSLDADDLETLRSLGYIR